MHSKLRTSLIRLLQTYRPRWQYAVALAVLLVGAVISLTVFVVLRDQQRTCINRDLEEESHDYVSAIRKTLALDFLQVRSLKAFLDGSTDVERKEFATYASTLLDRPSLRSLQWAPRISTANRNEHEEAARHEGITGYRIKDFNRRGQVVAAAPRDEYFPVRFAEPAEVNPLAPGLDLAMVPACRRAMNQACDTGRDGRDSRHLAAA